MTIASNLGFPPLGAARELKRATEGYWSGKVSRAQLLATGVELRRRHWQLQRDIGLDRIPVNDFSFYDRMLDTCALVGAVPPRYGWKGSEIDLDTYFAMARGSQGKGRDVTAMEMTKRSEEHTSELQSRLHLVCRLLLEKKKSHQPRVARSGEARTS